MLREGRDASRYTTAALLANITVAQKEARDTLRAMVQVQAAMRGIAKGFGIIVEGSGLLGSVPDLEKLLQTYKEEAVVIEACAEAWGAAQWRTAAGIEPKSCRPKKGTPRQDI